MHYLFIYNNTFNLLDMNTILESDDWSKFEFWHNSLRTSCLWRGDQQPQHSISFTKHKPRTHLESPDSSLVAVSWVGSGCKINHSLLEGGICVQDKRQSSRLGWNWLFSITSLQNSAVFCIPEIHTKKGSFHESTHENNFPRDHKINSIFMFKKKAKMPYAIMATFMRSISHKINSILMLKKKSKMAYAIQCSSTYQVKWMKRVSWGWGTQLHYWTKLKEISCTLY